MKVEIRIIYINIYTLAPKHFETDFFLEHLKIPFKKGIDLKLFLLLVESLLFAGCFLKIHVKKN